MSILFFWSVYFTLDHVYKVKAVFIVVLDRTTGHTLLGNLHYQFNLATKVTYLLLQIDSIGMPTVNKRGYCLMDI